MPLTKANLHVLCKEERDRRYVLIRQELRELEVDYVIVTGTTLLYITNGLLSERYGLRPTEEAAPPIVVNFRSVADIRVQVYFDRQDGIHIREGPDASHLIEEPSLENPTLSVANWAMAASTGLLRSTSKRVPTAKLVDVSDVLNTVQPSKAREKIAMIDATNTISDIPGRRVCEVTMPDMLGRKFVQEVIKTMWDAGGDAHSTFNFRFRTVPKQSPC